jgi:SAM-dependent methyltransferase
MPTTRHVCPVCGRLAAVRLTFPEYAVLGCPGCGHEFTPTLPARVAETYDPAYFQKAHANWFANPDAGLFAALATAIRRLAGPAARVIDVGCGNGAFLKFLAGQGFANLTGLDIIAQTLPAPIRYLHTPIEDYQGGETFDAVVSLANIEHLPDPRRAMAALARLVRPGGLVAVYTVANESLLYTAAKGLAACGVSFAAARLYDPHHVSHFSVPSLARAAADCGLTRLALTRRDIPGKAVDLPAGPLRPAISLAVAAVSALAAATNSQMLQLALFTPTADCGTRDDAR